MGNGEIEIKEVGKEEVLKLSRGLIDFNPEKCLTCGNEKNIVQRFFLLNVSLESESVHRKVKKILKEKFGLTYYGYCDNNKNLITTGKCPECDGEKMNWDY